MAFRITEATQADRAAWDSFVDTHPLGSPFHLWAWRNCLHSTFGYEPVYLMAQDDTGILGILPLFLVSGFFSGRALVSAPFAVYGGALSDSQEVADSLRDHVLKLARTARAGFVDLRNAHPEQTLGFHQVDRYVTFRQDIRAGSLDELLADIPKKTRNMVRKAFKSDLQPHFGPSDWRPFERLHSATLRRLGTPCFPPAHFESILREFGDKTLLFELRHGDRLAAASLSFLYKNSFHIYYACTDPDLTHLAPNYRMYAELLLWAGNHGFTEFDFGRSKLDTGTFEFKKHWATRMIPLPYEMHLAPGRPLPDLTPKNPKFSIAIKAWQRMPLWLTRAIGPKLIRQFP
jgi:FemAB-related protein (PEP-CTERM system-associated)